jgi:hypothetical protein
METNIVTVNSLYSDKHSSSCNFSVDFHQTFVNVLGIKLVGGHIPETSHKFLYYDIAESFDGNIYSPFGSKYCGILRWEPIVTGTTVPFITLDSAKFNYRSNHMKTHRDRLNRLSVKIYDMYGNLHSFGNDYLNITSITPGSPSTITTTTNHGLAIGDIISITDIDNSSSIHMNNLLNNIHTVVGTPALNQFTIAVNTALEPANNYNTNIDDTLYPLGGNGFMEYMTTQRLNIDHLSAHVSGTEVTTKNNHTLLVGDKIKIVGVDNCSTMNDNEIINRYHTVLLVTGANTFVVGTTLSAYPANSMITGIAGPPYLLGSNGHVKLEKFQITLDFQIIQGDRLYFPKVRLTNPYPDSVRDNYYNTFQKYVP